MSLNGKHDGILLGLDSIRSLMRHLGDVQEQLKIIHVAGTNGKGSVCAVISEILQQAGYRTGVYSSPAVFDLNEIIRIDGEQISQETYAELAAKVQAACVQMQEEGSRHPTAFEIETAIAFCFFWQEDCDFVVLETGLGGAGDATNLIMHPVCSVLTSISRDHMAYLGETLAQIAAAKAGIIKRGCPCVTAAQEPEALAVIQKTAAEMGSELRIADHSLIEDYEYDAQESRFCLAGDFGPDLDQRQVRCRLTGAFQQENLACALTAIRLLQEKGIRVTEEDISQGLSRVYMPGRFERICERPDFYIDGAHNEGAAAYLEKTVQNCFANRRIIYIIGVLADKEYEKVLAHMLPYAAQIYTVTPDDPRALDGKELENVIKIKMKKAGYPAVSYVPRIKDAVVQAVDAAGTEGVILAFGSFSYLRELRQAVKDTL